MNRSLVVVALLVVPSGVLGQQLTDAGGRVQVAMVKMPFTGARNVPEISDVPNYLEDGGLAGLLRDQGAVLRPIGEIGLTPEQQDDYGN